MRLKSSRLTRNTSPRQSGLDHIRELIEPIPLDAGPEHSGAIPVGKRPELTGSHSEGRCSASRLPPRLPKNRELTLRNRTDEPESQVPVHGIGPPHALGRVRGSSGIKPGRADFAHFRGHRNSEEDPYWIHAIHCTRPVFMARHTRLLIALVLGAALGGLLHPWKDNTALQAVATHGLQPVGQIFLRLIFMTVVPLVFSALVLGVYELGKGSGLGRVAAKTLGFTVITSACSVLIGILLVNTLRPGAGTGIDREMLSQQSGAVAALTENAERAKPASQALVELIPKNPVEVAAQALSGEMLAFMVFSLIFGVALTRVDAARGGSGAMHSFLEQLFALSMKIVDFAMALAPFGVFAIVFNTLFRLGAGILGSLAFFVAVVVAGLLIQQFVVYAALLRFGARTSPWRFFSACREVYLTAFSTASSNATLPTTLETAELKLGLPPRISRFVLTVGATANQNGTALFEGVTVLFLAQVYGIELGLGQQLQVVLMSILAGIGTAGVPGGSLPMIVLLLQSVGIPAEGIGLILGADRFLDMCRTTVNVSGDLVIAALASRGEAKA